MPDVEYPNFVTTQLRIRPPLKLGSEGIPYLQQKFGIFGRWEVSYSHYFGRGTLFSVASILRYRLQIHFFPARFARQKVEQGLRVSPLVNGHVMLEFGNKSDPLTTSRFRQGSPLF